MAKEEQAKEKVAPTSSVGSASSMGTMGEIAPKARAKEAKMEAKVAARGSSTSEELSMETATIVA